VFSVRKHTEKYSETNMYLQGWRDDRYRCGRTDWASSLFVSHAGAHCWKQQEYHPY